MTIPLLGLMLIGLGGFFIFISSMEWLDNGLFIGVVFLVGGLIIFLLANLINESTPANFLAFNVTWSFL